MSTFGQKGGDGPTAGKTASVYEVMIPDVGPIRKRSFDITDDVVIATGYMYGGKARIAVWQGEPAWEGEFGRLTARRVK